MKDETNDKKLDMDTGKSGLPALTIDWDLYGRYLEDSDLTDDQKREFIQTLWNIVVAFVDLGFGIDPVQSALREVRFVEQTSQIPSSDTMKQPRLSGQFGSMKRHPLEKEISEKGLKQ